MNKKYLGFLTGVTLLLLLLSAIMGIYIGDLTWAFVGIFGIVVLLLPCYFTKCLATTYNWKISIPLPFFLLAFLILALTYDVSIFEKLWPCSIAIQVLVTMLLGYMSLISIDMHTDSILSKQWLLIFSILIVCTFSAFYTFYIFFLMIEAGYFMDGSFTDHAEKALSNLMIMMNMMIASFVSLAYAVIMRIYLRNVTKEELSRYMGGEIIE